MYYIRRPNRLAGTILFILLCFPVIANVMASEKNVEELRHETITLDTVEENTTVVAVTVFDSTTLKENIFDEFKTGILESKAVLEVAEVIETAAEEITAEMDAVEVAESTETTEVAVEEITKSAETTEAVEIEEVVESAEVVEATETVETEPETYEAVSLGTFKTTAYCPCIKCCEGFTTTYTGTIPQANHTIAVDPNVIPLGSKIMIEGQLYVAEDVGGAIDNNDIDIFYPTHQEALNHGIKFSEVYLVK